MNPIVNGWYADPEACFFEGRYYIYVTKSFTNYSEQLNIDAFSSDDLVHGLEIAVSDSPAGPFRNLTGRSLVDRFIHYAQPIDAHFFKDDDGRIYLYYGGWQHCNAAVMNATMDGFIPFENGELFRSVSPENYVEGPCMLKRNGIYHFMWSEGDWVNGTYHVCTSSSSSPLEIGKHGRVILESSEIAEGPGHHSYINIQGTDDWLIVYHRRVVGDKEPGHRMLCIDKLMFDGDEILPVIMS